MILAHKELLVQWVINTPPGGTYTVQKRPEWVVTSRTSECYGGAKQGRVNTAVRSKVNKTTYVSNRKMYQFCLSLIFQPDAMRE